MHFTLDFHSWAVYAWGGWNKGSGSERQIGSAESAIFGKIKKLWMKHTFMKVSKNHPPVRSQVNTQSILTKNTMNVLGVLFDSKLQWQAQVQNLITKTKRSLHAIIWIRKYFNKFRRFNIITACYHAILYINSEIWYLPTNTHNAKNYSNRHLWPH